MALKEKLPDILEHIKDSKDLTDFNGHIFDILEGDLMSKVEDALEERLLSKNALAAAKKNIAPINILNQTMDKLTKIYSSPVLRIAENPTDQDIMDFYVKEMDLDVNFNESNLFFNSMKNAAMDPYLDGDLPRVRALPSHKFLVYSDDPVDPLRPTVFIKFMGRLSSNKDVDVYFLYSEDEFLAVDSEGSLLPQFTVDNDGENPFGVIPQTYINKSRHLILPKPDADLFQLSILVPLLLTNLNFAIEFSTHSVMYGIDVDVDNLELNPNSFWIFKTVEEGKTPSIGQIKPEVDIQEVQEYITKLMSMWLQSKSVKPGSVGNIDGDKAASGVALMIQNADTTEAKKEQMRYFEAGEKQFWAKIKEIHNYWASKGLVREKRLFSNDFGPSIEFREQKPLESIDERILRQKVLLEIKLSTAEIALKEIYPLKSEEEIQEMLDKIEAEKPDLTSFGFGQEDQGGEEEEE